MGRPLRIEFAGAIYHITSRGNRREPIYLNDGDRYAWQQILASVCARFHWRIHAFCQMGNHYHMIAETLAATLTRGMRQLNGEYTRRFNFRNATVGHLFQGRYHAILVQRQSYLLELSRYVVLNPVRAGMVSGPEAWAWSSFGMTCSDVPPPEWLETDSLLSQFGVERQDAVQSYRAFVAAGRGLKSPMTNLRNQLFVGDDNFLKQISAVEKRPTSSEISRTQKMLAAPELHEYDVRKATRQAAMARAYIDGSYTMAEIAAHFSVHYKTVSRAVRSYEAAQSTILRPSETKMYDCQT
ncbi:transposase [Massilia sp. TWR1-2-2]|uniref:transposase n=1 Tax=Massilia sp. TWR1-2-2 TaxID=2804584 RepID=UPI003CE86468